MKILFLFVVLFRENQAQDPCLSELVCKDVTLTATLADECIDGGSRNFVNSDFFISSSSSEDAKPDDVTSTCKWDSVSDGSLTITLGDCVDPNGDPNVELAKVDGDDIVYTYYIHHKRNVNGVDISMAFTQTVECKIDNTITEDGGIANVETQTQINAADAEWDVSAIEIEIEAPGGFNVGEQAKMKLKFGTAESDFNGLFTFAYQKCGIDPGTTPIDPPTLTILDDFCATTGFEEIVTSPGVTNGDQSFNNFDFTIFKFPKVDEVTFSCTVSIFLKDGSLGPALDKCDGSNRRKRENSGRAEQKVSISKTIKIREAPAIVTEGTIQASNENSSAVVPRIFVVFTVILAMIF